MTNSVSLLDLISMIPGFLLVIFSIVLLLMGAFLPSSGKRYLPFISLVGIFLSFVALILFWNRPGFTFYKTIAIDNYSLFFNLVVLMATGMVILMSVEYIRERGMETGEYYALLLLTTFGMFLMSSGISLLIIFLGLEILSLSLYILAGFDRREIRSLESSLKYYILGAFATGFLLYGIVLIYGAAGSIRLDEITLAIKKGGISLIF